MPITGIDRFSVRGRAGLGCVLLICLLASSTAGCLASLVEMLCCAMGKKSTERERKCTARTESHASIISLSCM